MLVDKDFLIWLLIGWQHSCQPIRSQVWKSLKYTVTCTGRCMAHFKHTCYHPWGLIPRISSCFILFQDVLETRRHALTGLLSQLLNERSSREQELLHRLVGGVWESGLLQYRISLPPNMCFVCLIILKFCPEHGSIAAVLYGNFQNDWDTEK